MNTSLFHIQPYRPADYERVAHLLLLLQSHLASIDTSGETIVPTNENVHAYLDQAIKDCETMNGVVLVAVHDDTIIGFIQGVCVTHDDNSLHALTHRQGREGWIGLLCTDPASRGKGVGSLLVAEIRKHFVRAGCTTMRLKVASENEHAIRLYEHLGFTPRDVVMAQDLTAA